MSGCDRVYFPVQTGEDICLTSIPSESIVRSTGINFNEDPEIPVIVAFVFCNFRYRQFDGKMKDGPGHHVLLLRRGFEVGSMRGLWTGMAGVHDVSSKTVINGEEIGEENAFRLKVAEEFTEELGWTLTEQDTMTRVATLRQVRPENQEQTFVKHVFRIDVHIHADDPTPPIRLDWEHIGCVWVPVSQVWCHLQNWRVTSLALSQVLKDGVTPDFRANLDAALMTCC